PTAAAAPAAGDPLAPQETVIEPDAPPVLVLLKRLAQGQSVSREEAHETLESLDCVVIGDPDVCAAKLKAYEAIGIDRIMCMMQYGSIPHAAVVRSIELIGEHLIGATAGRTRAPAVGG